MRVRLVNICQYEYNPRTGDSLNFNEQNIIAALKHKTIKKWAYIKHDKDTYTDEDEQNCVDVLIREYDALPSSVKAQMSREDYIAKEKWVLSGAIKPLHWHIVAWMQSAYELSVLAGWFGVPENMIEFPKGRNAFLDCLEYLTHEHPRQVALGKHRYDDAEVQTSGTYDFRLELDRLKISKAKYGRELDRKTELRVAVLEGEYSLNEVRRLFPVNFVDDRDRLIKCRADYLSKAQPPLVRFNYYICGSGGCGKSVASVLVARALFPDITEDEDLYFRVGAEGTTFEGYDGQPVIIWDDCRAVDLLKKLGGRGNVFSVFDTTPQKQKQNVKFGSVNLINSVNIVNSVQPWREFLDSLVGEYVDRYQIRHTSEISEKKQSSRRFPFIMPLRADDYDILINRGYMERNGDYDSYIKFENIRGNFGKLIQAAPRGSVKVIDVVSGMVKPFLTARDEVERLYIEDEDIDAAEAAFLAEVADYGMQNGIDENGEINYTDQNNS